MASGVEVYYTIDDYKQFNGIHPQGGVLIDRDSERAKLSNNGQSKNDDEV